MNDIQKFLKELKIHGEKNDIPNISENNAEFLSSMIQENKYQSILEIGSANGYSTMHFALAIKRLGGKITSIDFSQVAYEEAQDNFEKSGLSKYIQHYFGDARDIIPLLEESYDFIFIDGLKKASLDFYLLCKDKLNEGGVIIIDDVIKFRYKMENFYTYLEEKSIHYEIIQIDSDDGIMIIK